MKSFCNVSPSCTERRINLCVVRRLQHTRELTSLSRLMGQSCEAALGVPGLGVASLPCPDPFWLN